ncbi:MAG: 50S ribosomal protein L29 [Alphaproteobacteria bacterium]|nr:50S ribosomal protein L29 [Alphaproteobacteria bacterium]
MKAEDLKTKTADELQKLLLDTRKAQFNLRFQKTSGQADNPSEIRKLRRNVARIKTFLTQRRKEEAAAPKAKKTSSKKAA